ncbi:sugar phosphate isomerase/epimerase [Pedobacter sp. SYSU D00535]|uniref:sugar phosphate isomerase/epimerase family protein n=1 Tax=Pedobacter sp. SYSU D00535 TaxID=2810308 RepID=UPI001A95A2DA|nr:TIM barrel protein [Pedobacter sp. SYSU D00535]
MKKIILIFTILLTAALLSQGQTKKPKPLKVGYTLPANEVTSEKMKYVRSVGLESLELSLGYLIDHNTRKFKFSEAEILETLKKAKKAADDAGIEIWSIHMPFGKHIDISLTQESEREQVVAMHSKLIEYLRVLKPRVILFHPSWYLGLNERETRKQQMIRSAVELNKKVRKSGAIMVVENMLGFDLKLDSLRERPLCRTVDETVEIMGRLPTNIYSAVDMNHIKYPEKLILAMGKRMRSVHIADGTGKQENHWLPCSGKGQNNWNEILRALDKVGYRGPFIYESKFKDEKELKECYDTLYQNAFGAQG